MMQNKEGNYAGPAGITQRGNWKNWLLYVFKAVEVTVNITYDKINGIIAVKEAIMEAVMADTDIRRADSLITSIFTWPFTRVQHLVKAGIYAENTARKYLDLLTGMEIPEKRTVGKGNYFLNLELYSILSE